MSHSFADLISGGNQALRQNMMHAALSVRLATFVLSDEEMARGLIQHRLADDVCQKGFIILRPGDGHYLVASPKFRNLYYVVAKRQGRWMCSSDDRKTIEYCLTLVYVAERTSIEQAQRVAQAFALVANVKHDLQRWNLEIGLGSTQVSLHARFALDPEATPCWKWSLVDDELVKGTEAMIEEIKEILYTYDAYTPQGNEERAWLDERMALL